jgi:hypothetical protein
VTAEEDTSVVEVAVVVPAYNGGATIRGLVVKTMLGAVTGLRLRRNRRGGGALEATRSGVEAASVLCR